MIKETVAKSILRKSKKIDSWFLSSYSINPFRGCTHNCVYCDGRYEKYNVEGDFSNDIVIKTNTVELLNKELNPAKKRKPFNNGLVMICSGVSDAYQPLEKNYEISRKTLELLLKYKHPAHILTKSSLIERDLDLLQKINNQNKAIVSFSFSSTCDKTSKLLEPGVSLPSKRLKAIKKFKESGISCGMYLMPVVPYITDTYEILEETIIKAKESGVDFIIFGGMTLKEGRQKDYFMDFISNNYPLLKSKYEHLYSSNNQYGGPNNNYADSLNKMFDTIASKHKMPKRIPSSIFKSFVSTSELVILILEQLDYLCKLKGFNSPYGYSAYSLSQLKTPIEDLFPEELLTIKGIGQVTAKLIKEIIDTKDCKYYNQLL